MLMRCAATNVTQVMVGLHQVGIVGLAQALKTVEEEAPGDVDQAVDRLMDLLAADNYVPSPQVEALRRALSREYLRHEGNDFSAFLSEAEVTVRGEPGEQRDQFVAMVESVFADFELRPTVVFEPEDGEGPNPQLVIRDETIVRGLPSRRILKAAVHRSFSDW
jgi:hypothetical protein